MITPERFKEIRSLCADISDKLSEDELNAISDLLECSSDVIEIANTRPTPARCDELKTVAWLVSTEDCTDRGFVDAMAMQEGEFNLPVVTRQNAEEVIAAKDAWIDEYETGLVQMHQEMSALESDNKRLREALEAMLVPYEGSDCRRDHHGYCQEHYLEEDCCVAKARAVLGEVKP